MNYTAIVGYGANLGAREATFVKATALLTSEKAGVVCAVSPLYDTAPVGPPQPRYLNAAVRLEQALAPHELLAVLLSIEHQLGRRRSHEPRWGARPIDLDLLWHTTPVNTPELQVPHPRLTKRSFALAPLLDVAPELNTFYASALQRCGGPPLQHNI